MPSHPHGPCECTDNGICQCSTGEPGPAAYRVTRSNGRALNVCTRCTLPGDTHRKVLVTAETPAEPFRTYDVLGALCLAQALQSVHN